MKAILFFSLLYLTYLNTYHIVLEIKLNKVGVYEEEIKTFFYQISSSVASKELQKKIKPGYQKSSFICELISLKVHEFFTS